MGGSARPGQPPPLLFELVKADDVAGLNAYKGNPHLVDKAGYNAMMVAAKLRCQNALKWCIESGVGRAGVDKEERKEGLTALMLACQRWPPPNNASPPVDYDSPECAHALVRAGANPLKQDLAGKTCLHHAAIAGLPRIIQYLCSLSEAPLLVAVLDKESSRAIDYLTSPGRLLFTEGGEGMALAPVSVTEPPPLQKGGSGRSKKGSAGALVAKGVHSGGGQGEGAAAAAVTNPAGPGSHGGAPGDASEAGSAINPLAILRAVEGSPPVRVVGERVVVGVGGWGWRALAGERHGLGTCLQLTFCGCVGWVGLRASGCFAPPGVFPHGAYLSCRARCRG
jgi:hypothetical protein